MLDQKKILDINNFDLYDINFLRLDRSQILLEVDVSNNNIKTIDILNQYFQLKVINANHNRI